MLCMRYHSLVFSRLLKKPAVALFCSPKMVRAVADVPPHATFSLADVTCELASELAPKLAAALAGALVSCACLVGDAAPASPAAPACCWARARDLIFVDRRLSLAAVPVDVVRGTKDKETVDSARARVRSLLGVYLGLDPLEVLAMARRRGPLPLPPPHPSSRTWIDVARVVCYGVLGTVSSSAVWGLSENMRREDFCLDEAVSHVFGAQEKTGADRRDACPPSVLRYERKAFADIEPYLWSETYEGGGHRSGWAYAVGGMRSFDARSMLRTGGLPPHVVLDTYVDRTFHWGADALSCAGVLPLRSSWVGIVHHTFDTTHSVYNCVELFRKRVFLDSLPTCRALVALSDTLATRLRAALESVGARHVDVVALRHPMETVATTFTMDKFMANPTRRVVQIGAWLRNPYSIYSLPLWRNSLRLRKSALRGKDMDLYFPPPRLSDHILPLLLDDPPPPPPLTPALDPPPPPTLLKSVMSLLCCPPASSPKLPWPPEPFESASVSLTPTAMCRPPASVLKNKMVRGLCEAIQTSLSDVDVLERLSNADYDELMASNLVFLDLVDCSAVNTVLECIVRNTPLVVRRNATLEEVLGKDYPGFYEDLVDAALFLNDENAVRSAHTYLATTLDKTRFSLDRFVQDLQDVLHRASSCSASSPS